MLIQDIERILEDAGIEQNEAKVEVKLLIEHFAGYSLVDILMGKKLDADKLKLVEQKAKLRAETLQPIQYIIGQADFMGRKFFVNPSVLIPRDETELLVRKALDIIKQNGYYSVLDMCTGSGCIACMIAELNKDTQVMGVDISVEALHVALSNMEHMELFNRATFRKSDLFSKIRSDEQFDIIVSNPPYIPTKQKMLIQKEVSYEPDLALYTADDKGLEFYEKISFEAPRFLNPGGYIMFEIGMGQGSAVANILNNAGFKNIQILKDLANIDRVIWGNL